MKILHVVDLISIDTGGGTAQVAYYLSQEQAKLGHDVTIYCSDTKAGKQEAPEGVTLKKFHSIYYLLKAWSLTPGMLFADFKSYDVVHLHNYRTIVNLIAGLKSKNLILQAHGNCQNINGITGFIYHLVWRNIVFKRCKGFIADALLEASQYIAEGAMAKDTKVIPVGINMAEYTQLPERNNHAKKQIRYLGKFYWIKGADILARAVALLDRKDIEFVVSGIDFGYEATFRKLVKELGLEDITIYTGGKFGKEKLQAFVDADIYVMPSRYEMWGITFMEALACGTPVLMTKDCQAWAELPLYCGMSVNATPKDLARAINYALDNKLANEHRAERIEWVRKYDWPIIAKRTIEYYEKVLTNA